MFRNASLLPSSTTCSSSPSLPKHCDPELRNVLCLFSSCLTKSTMLTSSSWREKKKVNSQFLVAWRKIQLLLLCCTCTDQKYGIQLFMRLLGRLPAVNRGEFAYVCPHKIFLDHKKHTEFYSPKGSFKLSACMFTM